MMSGDRAPVTLVRTIYKKEREDLRGKKGRVLANSSFGVCCAGGPLILPMSNDPAEDLMVGVATFGPLCAQSKFSLSFLFVDAPLFFLCVYLLFNSAHLVLVVRVDVSSISHHLHPDQFSLQVPANLYLQQFRVGPRVSQLRGRRYLFPGSDSHTGCGTRHVLSRHIRTDPDPTHASSRRGGHGTARDGLYPV